MLVSEASKVSSDSEHPKQIKRRHRKPIDPSTMMDKPFMSTKEVAALLCASEVTLRMSRQDGVLFGRTAPEHVKIGPRKVLYETKVIKDWIAAAPRRVVSDDEEWS